MVQEAAVALVSAAAEAGQDEFGRFYDVVMPFLMQVGGSGTVPMLVRDVR